MYQETYNPNVNADRMFGKWRYSVAFWPSMTPPSLQDVSDKKFFIVKICKDKEQAYKAEDKPQPKCRRHPNWAGVS
jgi:hypothetical protein